MRIDLDTGAPQFGVSDLRGAGREITDQKGIAYIVTEDDLNLWLRRYFWDLSQRSLRWEKIRVLIKEIALESTKKERVMKTKKTKTKKTKKK